MLPSLFCLSPLSLAVQFHESQLIEHGVFIAPASQQTAKPRGAPYIPPTDSPSPTVPQQNSAVLSEPAVHPEHALPPELPEQKVISVTPVNVEPPSPVIETPVLYSYFIYHDERYTDAINRWLKNDNFNHIAWAINEPTAQALNASPTGTLSFAGDISAAIQQLAKQLNIRLFVQVDRYRSQIGIHQWQGREVQISLISGSSLQAAILNLAEQYDWTWIENGKDKSWLATNDYPFGSAYPIITPKGDLDSALRIVLEGYPVSAQLLDATHMLFIVDTQ